MPSTDTHLGDKLPINDTRNIPIIITSLRSVTDILPDDEINQLIDRKLSRLITALS